MLGSGTQLDPYKVSVPQDLSDIRNNTAQGVYYELINDIDMAAFGNFVPIGVSSGFRGNFDGKGYKIKNLTINYENIYPSLFAQYFYGTCQNLGLENTRINANSPNGQSYSGALAGSTYSATFRNCYVSGGYVKAVDESGGMFGKLNASTVEDCYSNNEVVLTSSYYGGGLAGSVDTGSLIRKSLSVGKVTYTQSSPWNGKSGFVGFVRDNTVVFENCYYNKETSTQSLLTSWGNPPNTAVVGVTGKTTAEMKTQSTYLGWDFTNIWVIQNEYPTLRVFGVPIVAKKETVSVITFSNSLVSNSNKSQKSTKQLQSFTDTIQTKFMRHTATLKQVKGYLSQIETTANMNARTVRSGNRDVKTFINPIGSFVYRESKTIMNLLSYIKPLSSDTVVIYPLNTITPNAYVSIAENTSRAFKTDNMTTVSYITNPSYVEVRE